ncbi:MAG: hypothetical protein VB957_04970 [Pseudomonadales bacterium]
MRILSTLVFTLLLVSCSDPLIGIPGGELSGEIASPPAVWGNVPETIQLETRPSEPYSINIWSVGIEQSLYIATSEEGTNWTEFFTSDANVRVRIDGTVYPLAAVPIMDTNERNRVISAYTNKYDHSELGMIFRLDRRM